MKRNTITVLIVLLSVSILFATLLTLPRIDKAQPDPYFHVKITPIIYWIGFSLAIFVTLGIVFSKKERSGRYGLGLFSVMLLSVYVYDIPKLFYVNRIYTDTYIFVGELLHTLRYGYLGSGHAQETPGLALFSSQFSLITGIDYIIVAEILQLIIPLLTIFFIYMIGKLFTNKRVALLACLTFISINWIGFNFNRQSLALVLQMFTYYGVFKAFSFKSRLRLSWGAMILLSYATLVIFHPLSSLLVPLTTLSLIALTYLSSLARHFWHTTANNESISRRTLIIRASQLSLAFLAIWFSWNIYVYKNWDSLVATILKTIQEFTGQPNPVEPAKSFVSGYSNTYLPIVYLRMLEFAYEAIIGTLLAFIAVVRMKPRRKSIILLSWFVSCMFISPSGLYTGHFFDRTFLHAFPVFSIFFAWFIIPKIPKSRQPKSNRKAWLKAIKGFFLGTMIIFMLMLPITIYCNTPFMYPPTSYLKEMDYTTRYGNGYIAVFEASSGIGYFKLLNNASNIIVDFEYNITTATEYGTVVTTFRSYTKDAFIIQQPSLTQSITDLENKFTKNPIFARVYDADSWHRIYVKQSDNNMS